MTSPPFTDELLMKSVVVVFAFNVPPTAKVIWRRVDEICTRRLLVCAEASHPCADPESFVKGGLNLKSFFFLAAEGREDPNTTLSGPSLACQQITGVPMMAQHCDFSGDLGQYCLETLYEPQHFQQCGMCDQQGLRSACAYAQSDLSPC